MTLTRGLSTLFGVLMAGSAAAGSDPPAAAAAVAALAAVCVAMVFRPAATLAVCLAVAALGLSDGPVVCAGLSGLCSAAYLVCRHAAPRNSGGVRPPDWPTVSGAVGFGCAGLVAASIPPRLPWIPLAAPLGALAVYLVATYPFVHYPKTASRRADW